MVKAKITTEETTVVNQIDEIPIKLYMAKGEKGDPGDDGQNGADGADGFSPTVETSKTGKVTTITITDVDGEHTATILDGADGQGTGDMLKATYDTNANGVVDNAEKVNSHTVEDDVPDGFFSGEADATAEGTTIELPDALKLQSAELNGDTFQQTYQGYNLVDLVPITNSSISYSQSVTTETVMDSTLGRNVLHIVATSSYPTVTYNLPTRFEMGKYYSFKITYRTITAGSGTAANEFWFGVNTVGNTWDNLALFNVGIIDKGADGDTSRFFNASDTWVTKSKRFYADPSIFTSTDAFKRVQLSFGYGPGLNGVTAKEAWIADVQVYEITEAEWNADTYTSKDYEPYAGSTSTQITPSPNPDYPQDIQVVTGTQTVTISDGDEQSQTYTINLGSNLVDISTFEMGGMSNGRKTESTYRITNINNPLPVLPNTTYTMSAELGSGILGFRAGVHQLDANKAFVSDSNWQQLATGNYTFTTSANTRYIGIVCSLSTTSATVNTGSTENLTAFTSPSQWLRGCTLWVEKGNTVRHFPPIELCKIGDYQDYIYKSGDDWYVHKEVNKTKLAGSGWVVGLAGYPVYYTTSITDYATSNNIPFCAIFSGATNVAGVYGARDLPDNSCAFINISGDTTPRFYVNSSKFANASELNTFLANNDTYIYYALATATDTQITDSTLIGQLEALKNAQVFSGETIFETSGNLPAILSLGYIRANVKGIVETIPTVNDATLKIQANGTDVATFTANASENVTANIGAATTSAYGVTKLSSSTSSTSTTEAATPSAVKAAYDLANGKQSPLTAGTGIDITSNTISVTNIRYGTSAPSASEGNNGDIFIVYEE